MSIPATILFATLCPLVVGAWPQKEAPSLADPALLSRRDADVHNYLVTRLRLLKRGTAVEELKSELVDEIDLGSTWLCFRWRGVRCRTLKSTKQTLALCRQNRIPFGKLNRVSSVGNGNLDKPTVGLNRLRRLFQCHCSIRVSFGSARRVLDDLRVLMNGFDNSALRTQRVREVRSNLAGSFDGECSIQVRYCVAQ
jgi:hypothetical protein